MEDRDIVKRIGELAERERTLESAHIGEGLSPDDAEHLHELQVQLDQCWDLLAQRRARRTAGKDPDEAQIRGEAVVEHYLQ